MRERKKKRERERDILRARTCNLIKITSFDALP